MCASPPSSRKRIVTSVDRRALTAILGVELLPGLLGALRTLERVEPPLRADELRELGVRLTELTTAAFAVLEQRGPVPDALHSLGARLAACVMAVNFCATDLRHDAERRHRLISSAAMQLTGVISDLQ
jgi:hypothetical protein